MLSFSSTTKVYVALAPVDLRAGHDGLCSRVRSILELDPFSGHVFVFFGRRGDRIKAVFWDRGGFVVYYKRLAKGRFAMPRARDRDDRVVLDATELTMLLGGFTVQQASRSSAWRPPAERVLRAG